MRLLPARCPACLLACLPAAGGSATTVESGADVIDAEFLFLPSEWGGGGGAVPEGISCCKWELC